MWALSVLDEGPLPVAHAGCRVTKGRRRRRFYIDTVHRLRSEAAALERRRPGPGGRLTKLILGLRGQARRIKGHCRQSSKPRRCEKKPDSLVTRLVADPIGERLREMNATTRADWVQMRWIGMQAYMPSKDNA
jgi:hypothetical protein